MGLMMLAASPGITIIVTATGTDAAEALTRSTSSSPTGSAKRTRPPDQPLTRPDLYIKISLYLHCLPATGLL